MPFSQSDKVYVRGYSDYAIPYLDITKYGFDEKLVGQFNKKQMLDLKFIPLDIYGNIMTVVVEKPSIELIIKLESITQKVIRVFYSTESKIDSKIQELKTEKKGFHIKEIPELAWKG